MKNGLPGKPKMFDNGGGNVERDFSSARPCEMLSAQVTYFCYYHENLLMPCYNNLCVLRLSIVYEDHDLFGNFIFWLIFTFS